jgi:ferritin-like metal-binding protein YciE
MKILTLEDLYVDQLRDVHSAERQLIKSLPKMVKAASHPQLKDAFKSHLEETKEHVARLDGIFEELGKAPGRKVCQAMVGLVKEGGEMIDADADEQARDAGLICAAQKIEHYEIATYGCLRTFATVLGRTADVKVLEKTLQEEKDADVALTEIAMDAVNAKAAA